MQYQFTPAAERALTVAAQWRSDARSEELQGAEVLLALTAEPECRAALDLAEHGIDVAAVKRRWPSLVKAETAEPSQPRPFSPLLDAALRAAEARLFEYPRPLALATEHLLLGLVAAEGEVSCWLRQAGLEPHALEADIHRRSGHAPGPLAVDFGDAGQDESLAQGRAQPAKPAFAQPAQESLAMPPHEQIALLRVIDAAANRAGEGLRVVEDYLRFVLDDAFLSRQCKELRHDLAAALAAFSHELRHAARETQADVGAGVTLGDEQSRSDLSEVVTASFKRVEQALRTLEEYAKVADPAAAAKVELLRYRTYTLERTVDIGRTSLARLKSARLYVLTDGRRSAEELGRLVESLTGAGVRLIQLRDKSLSDRELLERARLVARLTRESGTLFVMNDRADLALLTGADGVHVGQEELTVKDARTIMGPRALVGVSTHTLEQARQAVLAGANYIGVGPTFSSTTKEFTEFAGIELLRQVASEIRLPAFAIGGITRENVPQVLAAGATRIAVSGAVTSAADPVAAVRELLALLG